MEADGTRPNVVTYTTLMKLYSNAGDVEGSMEVLNMLDSNGFTGTELTYTNLLKAYYLGHTLKQTHTHTHTHTRTQTNK
jgi:pentatricopeptide repeat protein